MQIADLYQTHYGDILRYLKRYLSDAHAEDLAQEVFVKADKGLADFRGEASPKTWLYRIATNTLRDFLRSRQHRDDQACRPIPEHELEQFESAMPAVVSIEQGTIRNEMNACIREFIHRLPEGYSAVLVLGDLEEHTNKEIAETLGLTLDTVKIRLHRARERLKQELSQGCHFSHNADNDLECQRKDC